MRFVYRFVCAILPALVTSLPILPSRGESGTMSQVTILERDADAAYAKFELEGLPDELTSPLVFDFRIHEQVNTIDGLQSTRLLLNSVVLDIQWDRQNASPSLGAVSLNSTNGALVPAPTPLAVHKASTHSLAIEDHFGFVRQVELLVSGSLSLLPKLNVGDNSQSSLVFVVRSIDGVGLLDDIGFAVVVNSNPYLNNNPPSRLLLMDVAPLSRVPPGTDDLKLLPDLPSHTGGAVDHAYQLEMEIQSLILLEEQAGSLQAEIALRKQRIAHRLRQHRDQVSLDHLLKQCDGIICAAKVIAQRICDKIGISLEPSFKYSKIQGSNTQGVITLDEKAGAAWNATQRPSNGTRPSTLPLNSIHNDTSTALRMVDLTTPTATLIQILEFMATALGLVALISFIRRKCMSPRSRAERAADREERRNARAYRRAARRAYISGRWNAFITALSCFKPEDTAPAARLADYEEKRALILQDAFLEQEVDIAEKGEVMEAEIRELRNAHDIVRSLVSNGEEVPPLYHDPPPPMVPLPQSFTPVTARSRASTHTLPSYTSESLPDYSSRPDMEHDPLLMSPTLDGSSSSGLGSTASDTEGDRADTIFSSLILSDDGHSGSERGWRAHDGSRSTPTSSVIETSPRPSDETLRTTGRSSRDC